MDFFEVVRCRRSIRAYRPDAVEEQKFDRVLAAANGGPAAGNLQAYQVVVSETPRGGGSSPRDRSVKRTSRGCRPCSSSSNHFAALNS